MNIRKVDHKKHYFIPIPFFLSREISINLSIWSTISIRSTSSNRKVRSYKHYSILSDWFFCYRISITDQSLMSQLYPINFNLSTQSIYIEQLVSAENAAINAKNLTIVFRPIIPKVLTRNVLSSTVDNIQHLSHSNTNHILTNSDQQDYSTVSNNLTSTYRSLS
jgi:hypothetical protein